MASSPDRGPKEILEKCVHCCRLIANLPFEHLDVQRAAVRNRLGFGWCAGCVRCVESPALLDRRLPLHL
jgi:hypothetical protein